MKDGRVKLSHHQIKALIRIRNEENYMWPAWLIHMGTRRVLHKNGLIEYVEKPGSYYAPGVRLTAAGTKWLKDWDDGR